MLDKYLYTISLSHYIIDDFMAILTKQAISILVDIRSEPSASATSNVTQEILREKFEPLNLIYHWAGRQFGVMPSASDPSIHTQLAESLKGYAQYMQGPDFSRAAMQLFNFVSKGTTAVIYAEENFEQSHCRLISDYLLLQGMLVKNILSNDQVSEYQLSPTARRESSELIYDRIVQD